MPTDAPPQPETRSNSDLLDELRSAVADRPRWRLHVHPEALMWIAISVHNTGLTEHVQVVADPGCRDIGQGWIETFSVEQWRALRALVGRQVSVSTADLGGLTGELLSLDHAEARLDLGDGDVRYLPWLTIQDADHAAGRTVRFGSAEEMDAHLDAIPPPP